MIVMHHKILRLIPRVFNFNSYWAWFGSEKVKFSLFFSHILRHVFTIFLVFCMIVIDYKRLRLLPTTFNFGPYLTWLWEQNIIFSPFCPYLGNSTIIRHSKPHLAAYINISNTFTISLVDSFFTFPEIAKKWSS